MAIQYRGISTPNEVDEIYTQLQQYSFQIGDMLQQARKFDVSDLDSAERAIMIASEARTLGKRIEDVKKQITAPAREFVSKINDTANSFTEKLDEIENDLLAKIDQWKTADRIKREEDAFFSGTPTIYQSDYSVIRTEKGSAHEKVSYEFILVDPTKVPDGCLQLNTKQCEHLVKMGVKSIDGIIIKEKVTTSLRTK